MFISFMNVEKLQAVASSDPIMMYVISRCSCVCVCVCVCMCMCACVHVCVRVHV